jgi:hypothetical protein
LAALETEGDEALLGKVEDVWARKRDLRANSVF